MRRPLSVLALVLALTACAKEPEPEPVAAPAEPEAQVVAVADIEAPRVTATSGSQCLTDAELEAEQMLILHTELMVAAMSCDRLLKRPDMMAGYKDFTLRLHDLLKVSQDTMENFLAKGGAKNKKRAFDAYRTEMANDAAQVVRAMTARSYCDAIAPRWEEARGFTADDLRAYVKAAAERQRANYPVCTQRAAVAAP